jgi:Na+/proline symporter
VLAPASILTENVLRGVFTRIKLSDRSMLLTLRVLLVIVAIVSTTLAVNSKSTMYEMVESGYSVTLVAAFVPLVLGIYWSRSTTQGALVSIVLGVSTWLGMMTVCDEESEILWKLVPPQLYGLVASFIGMMAGSLVPNVIKHTQASPEELAQRRSIGGGH